MNGAQRSPAACSEPGCLPQHPGEPTRVSLTDGQPRPQEAQGPAHQQPRRHSSSEPLSRGVQILDPPPPQAPPTNGQSPQGLGGGAGEGDPDRKGRREEKGGCGCTLGGGNATGQWVQGRRPRDCPPTPAPRKHTCLTRMQTREVTLECTPQSRPQGLKALDPSPVPGQDSGQFLCKQASYGDTSTPWPPKLPK